MRGERNYNKAKKILESFFDIDQIPKNTKSKLYQNYLTFLRKAAYVGNGKAQFDLALHYEEINHLGVNPKYNPKKVFYWCSKACRNNIGEACNNLGTYFESGVGCKKDIKLALEFYKKSKFLGNNLAEENYNDALKKLSEYK